jgi:hypothetical protein
MHRDSLAEIRPPRKPRRRWENIKMKLRETEWGTLDLIRRAQDRKKLPFL